MHAEKLLKQHRIISEQMTRDELAVLLRELERALAVNVSGDVVELGCYEGTSALFFQRMLQQVQSDKKLWLYDSFEGLPEKTQADEAAHGTLFVGGALKASPSRLKHNFVKADLPLPEIKKAWFWELTPADLPPQICFAFLDGDFYESIRDSLQLVWSQMSKGGVVIIDDYGNSRLPGARKAVDEFSAVHNLNVKAEKSLAIIIK